MTITIEDDKRALLTSNDPFVREGLAEEGLFLDKLKNDPAWNVRAAVAEQKFAHWVLKDDKDVRVRLIVARTGEPLVSMDMSRDKSPLVRGAVASRGFSHNVLKDDKDPYVRASVAATGNFKEDFLKDEDPFVREAAKDAR